MPDLYSIAELVAATGGQLRNADHVLAVTGVSIDSRDLAGGELFVAIKGDVHDGHAFVPQALDAGAALALVSAQKADEFAGRPILIVPDVLIGLEQIGAHARARTNARIIAVTGSVGKTTTKEALRGVLESFGRTHASIKSFNNHWGVPLMLARMPADTQFGVFEIGMNHSGEITPLSKMVRPHIAIVTSVAAAHLEAFDSVAQIAQAKAEIFAGLEPDGVAILNADHEYLDVLVQGAKAAGAARILTFGFAAEADIHIIADIASAEGASAQVTGLGAPVQLVLHVPGKHMLSNTTATLCVAETLGLSRDQALARLAVFAAPAGRGNVQIFGEGANQFTLIDESYNANPASMAAALDVFASYDAPGRKIIVLGDMLELGQHSASLHAGLASHVIAALPDKVYLVGAQMGALADALVEHLDAGHLDVVHAEARDQVDQRILNGLALGDALMVKGSNGVGLSALVQSVCGKFAERDADHK